VFLSGARQAGKTTLVLQVIQDLLNSGVPAANILYATFDHPVLKLAGVDAVLEAWREREPRRDGPEYVFLDEAQFIPEHGTWVKHQVDFEKQRRIVFTGSAMPLLESGPESGVGRWRTIRLTTLSFCEYLKLRGVALPALPRIRSLKDLFDWSPQDLRRTAEVAQPYMGHFHTYLVHGGFPQTAQMDSVTQAQKLLREDIVDKVLKRDMTALFGVRRIAELERAFLYLCRHDGGLINGAAFFLAPQRKKWCILSKLGGPAHPNSTGIAPPPSCRPDTAAPPPRYRRATAGIPPRHRWDTAQLPPSHHFGGAVRHKGHARLLWDPVPLRTL
jgi:predicted AAA+ superfamily ATPase